MNTTLLGRAEIGSMLERMALQALTRHTTTDNLMVLGIQRRGADLANRLTAILQAKTGHLIPLGTLDINLYRDDWTSLSSMPVLGPSSIPVPLDKREVLLVDDVLYTGRTVRAALEAILDYGRPDRVELMVLVDRGHRELPIQADYAGYTVNTSNAERVDVLLAERDGIDEVRLTTV